MMISLGFYTFDMYSFSCKRLSNPKNPSESLLEFFDFVKTHSRRQKNKRQKDSGDPVERRESACMSPILAHCWRMQKGGASAHRMRFLRRIMSVWFQVALVIYRDNSTKRVSSALPALAVTLCSSLYGFLRIDYWILASAGLERFVCPPFSASWLQRFKRGSLSTSERTILEWEMRIPRHPGLVGLEWTLSLSCTLLREWVGFVGFQVRAWACVELGIWISVIEHVERVFLAFGLYALRICRICAPSQKPWLYTPTLTSLRWSMILHLYLTR